MTGEGTIVSIVLGCRCLLLIISSLAAHLRPLNRTNEPVIPMLAVEPGHGGMQMHTFEFAPTHAVETVAHGVLMPHESAWDGLDRFGVGTLETVAPGMPALHGAAAAWDGLDDFDVGTQPAWSEAAFAQFMEQYGEVPMDVYNHGLI